MQRQQPRAAASALGLQQQQRSPSHGHGTEPRAEAASAMEPSCGAQDHPLLGAHLQVGDLHCQHCWCAWADHHGMHVWPANMLPARISDRQSASMPVRSKHGDVRQPWPVPGFVKRQDSRRRSASGPKLSTLCSLAAPPRRRHAAPGGAHLLPTAAGHHRHRPHLVALLHPDHAGERVCPDDAFRHVLKSCRCTVYFSCNPKMPAGQGARGACCT